MNIINGTTTMSAGVAAHLSSILNKLPVYKIKSSRIRYDWYYRSATIANGDIL